MTKQLVFIDARVSDPQFLAHNVISGAQPFLIDPSIDGLAQILQRLANLAPSSLSSLSIVAHGAPGRLEIGPAGLSLSDIAARADELAAIGGFLAAGATVKLYACETGAGSAGAAFVTALSEALGANVAAAAHLVGAAERDGDWALDIGAHQLASQAPFNAETRASYSATLVAPAFGFVQNFEANTNGFLQGNALNNGTDYGSIERVASGTNGIPARSGSSFFAIVREGTSGGDNAGPFTRFGDYTTRPIDGQQADVRVYLDPAWAANQSFQYSVAANGADGAHIADFGFQVRANGSAIEVGASPGSGSTPITSTVPDAYLVTTPGWYTLQHNFHVDAGVLSVDMNLLGPAGDTHLIRTLTYDPATAPGNRAVGGIRYGWFTDVSVAGGVAIDDELLGAFRNNAIEGDNNTLNTTTAGAIGFTDTDSTTHTATFTPVGGGTGYVGTFALTGVTESDNPTSVERPGYVGFTFTAPNSALNHLAANQTVAQMYNVTLTDNQGESTTRTVTVNLQGTNDAATATNLTTTQTYTEDTPLNLTDIVVTDVDDNAVITARLTLNTPAAGALTTSGGATYNANTGIWSVTGTVVAVNTALANVGFTPAANYNQSVTITTSVSDGIAPAATGTITLNGTPVNDPPTATNLSTSQTYAVNTPLNLTDIVVSDVDANPSITATLTLSNPAAGTLSNGGGGAYNAGTGVFTVTGSVAAVNTALAAVTFTPATDYNQPVTIATSVTDNVAPAITGSTTLSVAAPGGGGGGGGGGGSTPTTGTSGADTIGGTSGNDNISGGGGADTVYAGQGSDTVTAGDDGNIIVGGEDSNDGADAITSGSGNDLIYGNGGDDSISSNGGNDVMVGGFGNDLISAGSGNDLIYGNESNDTISAGEGQNVVTGGKGDDQISAGAGADLLFGNEGSDTIVGGDGDNTIVGGQDSTDSADRLSAGSGNDFILGNGGDDTVGGGEGNNSLVGGYGNDAITAGAGNDVIYGNQDNDTISAGDGANLIFGGMGDDAVTAGSGNDTIWGNEGNDTLLGGTGADRYVFAAADGADLINGFSAAEGDKLDLQGQTYTVAQDANGNAVLTLSGGGLVTLAGVASNQVNAGFFA